MDAIVIAVDPTILQVGSISIRWFGVSIALGITIAIYIALLEARRMGVPEEAIYNCAIAGIIGGLAGARLFHVIDRFDFYLQNPATIAAFQEGGLSIWGAIFGGLLGGALYCRVAGHSFLGYVDLAAPALLIGQTVGRIGSFVNGDSFGSSVDLPWSVIYVHPDAVIPDLGEPTHPYPLYEMVWNALALGILWRMRGPAWRPGTVFLTYLVLYSIGRLVLGFARQESVLAFGLQQAQVIAVFVLITALPPLMWRLGRRSSGGMITRA